MQMENLNSQSLGYFLFYFWFVCFLFFWLAVNVKNVLSYFLFVILGNVAG